MQLEFGRMRWQLLIACCALVAVSSHHAQGNDGLLTADVPPHQAIDYYIRSRLQRQGVPSAPQADDANLLRRTMLDLVGRPPTAAEAKAYLASSDEGKRQQLVEQLMSSPAFVRQQAAEFDAWL